MDTSMLILIAVAIVIIYLLNSIKILREYERAVIFRLGRVLDQTKGPGIILVFAPLDRMVRVSLRIDAQEVPSQDVVTRDNVTVKVNAVIYSRVIDPRLAVLEVSNFFYATSQLAQTTLRSVLGEVDLDTLLSQREKLNVRLQSTLDQHTSAWGVKVTMVEVKQVDLAEQMVRVIARQAEAERERRAKIIHAEGEYTAAEKLSMAAEVMQKQPNAWGLYDMLGNVRGWTADWYEESYYQHSPSTDPQGPPSGRFRVVRGGSAFYGFSRYARASCRYYSEPVARSVYHISFRCVREATSLLLR